MAESTMTRAAPGDGEAAGALLATKELVKPEKSTGSIKGILAGAAAASFALGLLATVTPSTRQAPVGLAGDRWSLTCLLYTSPSPRDATLSSMPSSA